MSSTIKDAFYTEIVLTLQLSTQKHCETLKWKWNWNLDASLCIELYLYNIRSVKRLIFDWLEGSFETFYTWKESNCAEDEVLRPKRWSWKAVKWSCRTFDDPYSWIILPTYLHIKRKTKSLPQTFRVSAEFSCHIIIKRFKYWHRCWYFTFYVFCLRIFLSPRKKTKWTNFSPNLSAFLFLRA